MITVEEAQKHIASKEKDFGIEEVDLDEASGRVLRESVTADRDFPPYDRVTMDGIAIRFRDWEQGTRTFRIAGVAAAGAPQQTLKTSNECLEIMTGAIMPNGLDTVIRYEDLDITESYADVTSIQVKERQNVHFKGLDKKRGDILIPSGKRITSSEIGICATVGKTRLKMSKLPKTLIISSGDELVDIHETPEKHQIRKSNVYQIKSVLEALNIFPTLTHLSDDYESITQKLDSYCSAYDLIVLSGGVSKGKFDFLPKALAQVGIQQHFHRVAQRPGKPFWFGTGKIVTVFAFPGNPVSTFMCMHQYLKPWLYDCLQMEPQPLPKAILTEDVHFKPDLTYFLEVKIKYGNDGRLHASPIKGNGSGDLANLVNADAFIKLPPGSDTFKQGDAYPVIFYR
jgi:molybdopterin molybdotransferase